MLGKKTIVWERYNMTTTSAIFVHWFHAFVGQSSETGLRLQSFRTQNGLRADVIFPKKFQAFPGIVNGGLVSTVFDCQGNWTSAIALMDASQLPKPPFTLSSTIQVSLLNCSPSAPSPCALFHRNSCISWKHDHAELALAER